MVAQPPRRQLTVAERAEIIGMRKCGATFVAIGLNLQLKRNTVQKVWHYYEKTGLVSPPPRPGRPPIFTDRDRRQLKRYVRANRVNRRQALSDITATLNFDVSDWTLRNELRKVHLNHRVARKKPWLCPAQKLARLEFAHEYEDWDFEEWTRAIWTDEMAMQTASNEEKTYVWREPDEEYEEDCIEPTFIPGFRRVKVWGAIRYGRKSKLVVIPENIEKGKKLDAETYLTEIMDKELFDFWQEAMEECGQVYVMEDGAPPHQGVASVRRKELEQVGWEG